MAREQFAQLSFPVAGGSRISRVNVNPLDGKTFVGLKVSSDGNVDISGATFEVYGSFESDDLAFRADTLLGTLTTVDENAIHSEGFACQYDNIYIKYNKATETVGIWYVDVIAK